MGTCVQHPKQWGHRKVLGNILPNIKWQFASAPSHDKSIGSSTCISKILPESESFCRSHSRTCRELSLMFGCALKVAITEDSRTAHPQLLPWQHKLSKPDWNPMVQTPSVGLNNSCAGHHPKSFRRCIYLPTQIQGFDSRAAEILLWQSKC